MPFINRDGRSCRRAHGCSFETVLTISNHMQQSLVIVNTSVKIYAGKRNTILFQPEGISAKTQASYRQTLDAKTYHLRLSLYVMLRTDTLYSQNVMDSPYLIQKIDTDTIATIKPMMIIHA